MSKKIFLGFAIISAIIFFSSLSFAANPMQNAGDAVKDSLNTTGHTIQNVTGATTNAVKTGVDDMKANVGGAVTNVNKGANAPAATQNAGYTATRTATNNAFTRNSMTWTWITLGVVALAIAGLVWYYVSRRNEITD